MSKPSESKFPCMWSPDTSAVKVYWSRPDSIVFEVNEFCTETMAHLDRAAVHNLRDQLTAWLGGDNQECKCNMRTKLVGDGCSVCNPERAKDLEEGQ